MWVAFTEKVEAHVEVMPKVLNLKSQGQWVTAHISLPEPYKEEDIDVSSVKLWYKDSFVQAEWRKATKQFLMAKFPRNQVTEMLKSETGKVQLTVTGLVNGIEFSGTDTITVIKPER
jgi:RNA-binding protein YlmH